MRKQSVGAQEAVPVPVPVTVPGPPSAAPVPTPSQPYPYTTSGLPLGKKLIKQLEVNAWVAGLRASSPTHVRAPPASGASGDAGRVPWMVDLPSALSRFEEIVHLSQGKQIVVFLDYDGTLSPIVDDPDRAFMSEPMRAALRDVARYFPTAIVSGRCRDKVYSFVRLAELYYAGSHGMDIEGPKYAKGNKSVQFQPASEFLPMIQKVYKELLEKTSCIAGARLENNKFCVSVHFRCVDPQGWVGLAKLVRAVLHKYNKLRVTHGRKVLEIRPTIEWDKGKAIKFLLESLGFANCANVLPVYIGDDRTDEDAFKVLRESGQGLGILVSKVPKDTDACYSLKEPSEVMDFLQRLVEWKRLSMKLRPRV